VNRGRFAFISILLFHDLSGLDSMFRAPFFNPVMNRVAHESWEDVWEDLIYPCVGTKGNSNLSGPQKELLNLNWKLGVSMQRIQVMMKEHKSIYDDGREIK